MSPFHKSPFFPQIFNTNFKQFFCFYFQMPDSIFKFFFSLKFKHITYVKEWLQFEHLLWHDKESYTIYNCFLPLPERKVWHSKLLNCLIFIWKSYGSCFFSFKLFKKMPTLLYFNLIVDWDYLYKYICLQFIIVNSYFTFCNIWYLKLTFI